jgi:hypothetical protein
MFIFEIMEVPLGNDCIVQISFFLHCCQSCCRLIAVYSHSSPLPLSSFFPAGGGVSSVCTQANLCVFNLKRKLNRNEWTTLRHKYVYWTIFTSKSHATLEPNIGTCSLAIWDQHASLPTKAITGV